LAKANFDVILDCAGHSLFSLRQPALTPEERYVALLPHLSLGLAGLQLRVFSRQQIRGTIVRAHPADLASLLAREVTVGELKTVIKEVFLLENQSDELEESLEGQARGKIILTIACRNGWSVDTYHHPPPFAGAQDALGHA
jgi:NADPH:quinone reductase-like Zn-dependent oxidoreductase